MLCDSVINWLAFAPSEEDLRAICERTQGAVAMRTLVVRLVRNVLHQHPWIGRADLLPVFDARQTYAEGDVVAVPCKDEYGLNPDCWRIGKVVAVEEATNPAQGCFQLVTVDLSGRRETLVGAVATGRTLPLIFPPEHDDEDNWDTLSALLADSHFTALRRAVIAALEGFYGAVYLPNEDKVQIGITLTALPATAADALETFFRVTEGEMPQAQTLNDLLVRLREQGFLTDISEAAAKYALRCHLESRDFENVGGSQWMSVAQLEACSRRIRRQPSAPRIRTDFEVESAEAIELEPEAQKELEEYDEEDDGNSIVPKDSMDSWRQSRPEGAIKLPTLTYQQIVEAYFPLNRSLSRMFPPGNRVVVTLKMQGMENDGLSFLVDREEWTLKAFSQARHQWTDWFRLRGIPAGAFLWVERTSDFEYAVAPHSISPPRQVQCKQIWLEDGELQVEVADFAMRYEGNARIFYSEQRFADLEALYAEAQRADKSILQAMCEVFPKLQQAGGAVHHTELFNVVFFETRQCSPKYVLALLYQYRNSCFQSQGNGFWRYDPTAPMVKRPARRRVLRASIESVQFPALAFVNIPFRASARATGCTTLTLERLADGEQWKALAEKEGNPDGQKTWRFRLPLKREGHHRFRIVGKSAQGGTVVSPIVAVQVQSAPQVVPLPPPPIELPQQGDKQTPVHTPVIPTTADDVRAFITQYARTYDMRTDVYWQPPFASDVKAGKNTAIYNAHAYHTKVPPQGIEPYIEHYTESGDLVLDPFCGTGMTGVAALKLGRRAILNDLSPAACHIAYNYCTQVDVSALKQEFERIKAAMKDEFDWLYSTICGCGKQSVIQHVIWSDVFRCNSCGQEVTLWHSAVEGGKVSDTFPCPHCSAECDKDTMERLRSIPVVTNFICPGCGRTEHDTTDAERRRLTEIESKLIPYWYPVEPFDESREMWRGVHRDLGVTDVSKFYTPRNLWAMARLWHEIANAPDTVRDKLRFCFTAFAMLATRLYRYRTSGGGGPTGNLYIPTLTVENNIMKLAAAKLADICSAASEINKNNRDAAIVSCGTASSLPHIEDETVDYVFTDPPFGSNIFYADCNLIWESWLGQLTDERYEAVVHVKHKHKNTLPDYQRLMTESFKEMHRVLKPGRWASVVFHNKDDKVWRAIQAAARDAGFHLVNAQLFDKQQRSFKGIKGEKGEEDVTNFDIVLNLQKQPDPVFVHAARNGRGMDSQHKLEQAEVDQILLMAVGRHLLSDKVSDNYRTMQYIHSLALKTLLSMDIPVEVTMPTLAILLLRHGFKQVDGRWYLENEEVFTGQLLIDRITDETSALTWLYAELSEPQYKSDLVPKWQQATVDNMLLLASLDELLESNFVQDEESRWRIPTVQERKARQARLALIME